MSFSTFPSDLIDVAAAHCGGESSGLAFDQQHLAVDKRHGVKFVVRLASQCSCA
jgi:hypothetical protein